MAINHCLKKEKVWNVEYSGYEPVPGKTISIFPPSCCIPASFSLSGTDYKEWCSQPTPEYTEEQLQCYHDLKYKYGFSGLHVWLDNIDAALQAGWKCSELILSMPRCTFQKLRDPRTGTPYPGCEQALFKYIYLDEPNWSEGQRGWNGDYRSSRCHPCNPQFIKTLVQLAHQYDTKFVGGHWNEADLDIYSRLVDEVVLSTYGTNLYSDITGYYRGPAGNELENIVDLFVDIFGEVKPTWREMKEDYGTSRFWIEANSLYYPGGYNNLLEAANRLDASEIMIYGWEVADDEDNPVPCDIRMKQFHSLMEAFSSVAVQKGWLKRKSVSSQEYEWYKCIYEANCEELCDRNNPALWRRI
jgi:hypothetical protein